VKIFLFYIQNSMLMTGPFALAWLDWIALLQLAPDQLWAGSTCFMPLSPYQSFELALLYPFVLWALLALAGTVHAAVNRVRRVPFPRARYEATAVSIFLFSYTSLAQNCLSYLSCVDIGDASVVFVRPAVDCRNPSYRALLPLVTVMFAVFVVGVPLAAGALVLRYTSGTRDIRKNPVRAAALARCAPSHPFAHCVCLQLCLRRPLYDLSSRCAPPGLVCASVLVCGSVFVCASVFVCGFSVRLF
jgi:hypothetical protein